MPSIRYSFSCNDKHDLDIIEYLASFASPTERRIAIKEAIRSQMIIVITGEEALYEDRLLAIENTLRSELGKIMHAINEIRTEGVSVTGTVQRHKKTVDNRQLRVATKNIDSLLED